MKKSLFIGNCHNNGLIKFLSLSDEFRKTYSIKQYANWELIENKKSLPIKDIIEADLFIYQPLPPVHGCYSTDPSVENSIGTFVKSDCIKISYPYVYCSALWPLIQAGSGENRWFGNDVIDKLMSNGYNVDQIINMFLNNEIDWEYESRLIQTISILKEKESVTDLKISNFIMENLKKDLLFLIPQHPTSVIFLNLTNQILSKLGMSSLSEDIIIYKNDAKLPDSTYNCSSDMFPMHKSTILDLALEYGEEYTSNSEHFYVKRIEDYIKMNY